MTLWLFKEHVSGNMALFTAEEAAQEFRKKLDKYFIDDPEIGEAMDCSEWSITEVEVNPDFDKWIKE